METKRKRDSGKSSAGPDGHSNPNRPAATTGGRGSGRRSEAAVGVAIVLGVVALFFGVRFLENRPFLGGTYSLQTEFSSADGLMEGGEVRVSGVKVGEVSRVRLDPASHRVDVSLRIRSGVLIPRGAVAEVRGISALDDVHVTISTDGTEAPPLADGDRLVGATEPGLTDRADSTLASADQTFDDARSLLATTESELGIVLSNMQTASQEAATLLQSERDRLHATIAALHATVMQLGAVADQLDRVSSHGGDTLIVAMERLSVAMRRLDTAAGSLERGGTDMERVMAGVSAGEGTLGKLLQDPGLYGRFDSAAARLDSAAAKLTDLLDDFKNDPGRYLEKMELIDIF